jgi:hypothetical protein
VCFHACCRGCLKVRQTPLQQRRDAGSFKLGQDDGLKCLTASHRIRRLGGDQISFSLLMAVSMSARCFSAQKSSTDNEPRAVAGIASALVLKTRLCSSIFGDMGLESFVKGHPLCPYDELMQVLALRSIHREAGIDILRDKQIVEYSDVGQRLRPCSVLEDNRRAAATCDYHMWWVRRRQALAFNNRNRVSVPQGPKNGCERGLATAILGVH